MIEEEGPIEVSMATGEVNMGQGHLVVYQREITAETTAESNLFFLVFILIVNQHRYIYTQ